MKAILATPVLALEDVPLAAFHVGKDPGWQWEPLGAKPPEQSCQNHPERFGGVYFAANREGFTKIGFGYEPADRVAVQGLTPRLFVMVAQPKHERALHELFRAERSWSEFFSGPRVEAFISFGCGRSRSTLEAWSPKGFRAARARAMDERLRELGKAAV